ncbi:MAG: hypothetical protein ACLGSD_01005 [Acidobacteriota bacterium]
MKITWRTARRKMKHRHAEDRHACTDADHQDDVHAETAESHTGWHIYSPTTI